VAPPADNLLEVEGLRVSFATEAGDARVLDGVNLTIRPGEIMGLVGESGCGKTTLANAILGILARNARHEAGSIRFGGEDLLAMPRRRIEDEVRGRRITFIPQDPYGSFNPLFTVGAQVTEVMKWKSPQRAPRSSRGIGGFVSRYPSARRRAEAGAIAQMLRAVQIPDAGAALAKLPHEFSGGQRQRLMIALALLPQPQLVIADEPTTALDVTIQAQILKLLKGLAKKSGISVLFTTHDLGTAYEICDRITVMYAGQEVETASVDDFFRRPHHPYTVRLLESLPRPGRELREIGGEIPGLIRPPAGCRFHPRCARATEVCRTERPPVTALGGGHEVRFHPPSGRIVFEGRDVTGQSAAERRTLAPKLQYCYQDPGNSLDPRWTVRRSLAEPLIVHTQLTPGEREARIATILQQVGLPLTHLDLYPHELSGGQQRRVGLARILTLHPRLVVLDEPTSGLDVSVQASVLKLLRELQRVFSLTYLFISHDLSVVRLMCDRVAVMYAGRIVELAPTEAIFAAAKHPYTQSLLSAIPDIGGRRVTDTFALQGEPPDPTRPPSGCRFRTRCPIAAPVCIETDPPLRPITPGQSAACVLA